MDGDEPRGSTASAAICSRRRRRRRPSRSTRWSCSRRPGEGRESVEIARRVLREARRGVPFDRMAIALRAPQHYAGLLEHALERAGVPAYFERGTRRPHPAGRAFLALLACALDNLSARRFAEYLSLGQVPDRGAAPHRDDAFPDVERRSVRRARRAGGHARRADDEASSDGRGRGHAEPPRVPRAVEVGAAARRIARGGQRGPLGAPPERPDARVRAAAARARAHRPGSPRIDQLARKIDDLQSARGLRAADHADARRLAGRRRRGPSGWITSSALAPRVLRQPDRVLRVLADLRPMGAVGPVTLDEAARVLADRLASIEAEPPARRYGRVLVASPAQLRGRTFDVVFIPALAERMFPQKPREDPLLLDEARAAARRRPARRRPSGPSSRSCSCGWPSAPPNRGCTCRFRPWRSAKAVRACRRCTRSKSGAR